MDVPERANAASFWTILRRAMLRIAAQDEVSSSAGAFMPESWDLHTFVFGRVRPQTLRRVKCCVLASDRLSFLRSFRGSSILFEQAKGWHHFRAANQCSTICGAISEPIRRSRASFKQASNR
jgi:hypothetical protein